MVAKTIGTKVSFAFESEAGVRPTTGYEVWADCTSHPDFNPSPDQIETTPLIETYMHTYDDGLTDFGALEFGANLTNETYSLILGSQGYVSQYETKQAQGLRLWICVDIAGFAKSFYVPVKPQRNGFGLPSGEAGSNKYDLIVRFMPASSSSADAESAGWYDDPTYTTDTTHTATVSGYVSTGVELRVLDADTVIRTITTSDTTTSIVLPAGVYVIVASKSGKTTQVKDADLSSGNASITFSTFA